MGLNIGNFIKDNKSELLGVASLYISDDMLNTLDPLNQLAGGRETGIGNFAQDTGKNLFRAGLSSGNLGLMLAGGIGLGVGSIVNGLFGSSVDKEGLARLANYLNMMRNILLDANNNATLASLIGNINLYGVNLDRSKYKDSPFSHNGSRSYTADTAALNRAISTGMGNIINTVANSDMNRDLNILSNSKAYGGYLEGNVYDIDESEVQRLLDAGYLIEYL